MQDPIQTTLNERGGVYGPYEVGVRVRYKLLEIIKDGYKEIHGKEMDPFTASMISDITNKLSRLCGTPEYIDTWHDIAGYATRIKQVYLDSTPPKRPEVNS